MFSEPCLSNGNEFLQPPPPPPPLPPPTTPHIARRASLQEHMNEERKKPPLNLQRSMGDMLKDIDKVKLKPIARYIKIKLIFSYNRKFECRILYLILL
jgi:hypothetical protein